MMNEFSTVWGTPYTRDLGKLHALVAPPGRRHGLYGTILYLFITLAVSTQYLFSDPHFSLSIPKTTENSRLHSVMYNTIYSGRVVIIGQSSTTKAQNPQCIEMSQYSITVNIFITLSCIHVMGVYSHCANNAMQS